MELSFWDTAKSTFLSWQTILFLHYSTAVQSFKAGDDDTKQCNRAQLFVEILTCTDDTGFHKYLSYVIIQESVWTHSFRGFCFNVLFWEEKITITFWKERLPSFWQDAANYLKKKNIAITQLFLLCLITENETFNACLNAFYDDY